MQKHPTDFQIERAEVYHTGGVKRLELMKDLIDVLVLSDGNARQL